MPSSLKGVVDKTADFGLCTGKIGSVRSYPRNGYGVLILGRTWVTIILEEFYQFIGLDEF
jgi:hypothetical protein